VLAAREAGLREAAGEGAHERGEVAPCERLPDAEFLLAQGRRVGSAARVLEQQSGEGGVVHGRAVPQGTRERLHCRSKFDAVLSF